MNILGITFDCNLKWNQQYTKAIKEANTNLYAIKRIAKFFTKEERTTLNTSLFYSKLYCGSEVWHLPERTVAQNKMIKHASANALRIISKEITIYHTHTEIHQMTKRALPDQMIQYKHALMMYNYLEIACQTMNSCTSTSKPIWTKGYSITHFWKDKITRWEILFCSTECITWMPLFLSQWVVWRYIIY